MPDLIELSHSDIDEAVSELAALSGVSSADVWNAVREEAGFERDPEALAYGVSVVADALEDQGVWLAADLSAEERRHLASIAQALSDGSYPIPDKEHLHSAAILAASGHGDAEAAKRLIRKRAKELGVDVNSLPGFGGSDGDSGDDEDQDDVAASYYGSPMIEEYTTRYTPQSYRARQTVTLTDTLGDPADRWDQADPLDSYTLSLAASSDAAAQMFGLARSDGYSGLPGPHGTGGPEEILARSGHAAGVHLGGSGRAAHAEAEGGRGRHLKTCPPGCTRDHNQPKRGGVIHPEVDALIHRHPSLFGGDRPHGNSHSYRPLSDAERSAASRRARPGHTGHR